MLLGRKVRELRRAQGLSQERMAERAGITYKYLGQIERGEANPSIETLKGITEGLNLSLREFFTELDSEAERSGSPPESRKDVFLKERLAKYIPAEKERQELVLEAIKLFKKAFEKR